MSASAVVICKSTPLGVFVPCPVCKSGKLMRLFPDTTATAVGLYCRRCKRETIVDVRVGPGLDRVTLREILG